MDSEGGRGARSRNRAGKSRWRWQLLQKRWPQWAGRLAPRDLRAVTPLIWEQVIARAAVSGSIWEGNPARSQSKWPPVTRLLGLGLVGVVLEIPTLHIPDPIDSLVWHGQPSNASFIVEVPSDAAYGAHTGRAIITASAIPVTKLIFSLLVSPQAPVKDAAPIPATECAPRTAFASYSSRDRAEVLARVQGMHKIRPELDVFIDVISLRAGQQWEEEIGRHVRSDDIFFLFWSEHAAASREVEKEWRLALAERGIDYIDPVPLSDPAEVIPPCELQALHFNDYYLAHIKLNQRRRKGSSERKLWWKFW